ncbi:Ribose-phosphate pyrophosphokinase [uncultured spirochete]|uniref:ribose-phosphate diphosphokinase n=1 Tax=uncultured spirochete TaxID=156406 RepID=A0A3P3XPM2_9SPIR|nr:Ribose-phosphate pyrophosphokinase [uncultured spirochete]
MSYSDPTHLGIIACPGAEVFANQVIRKLAGIYKHRFARKAQAIAGRYHISPELVIRKINFANDCNTGMLFLAGDTDHYRPPQFKINVRHTFFANGEIKTEILESIRGRNIYIFQDIENHQPVAFNDGTVHKVLSVNDHIFNLFVAIDAAMQAGAAEINLVLPIYPYSRQHKKKGREGLTAARIGKMLESLGVNRIITLDIHSKEIENAFDRLRMENLHASFQIIDKLMSIVDLAKEDMVVLAPDTGAIDRSKFYANALQKPLALLYKERDYSKVSRNAAETNISEMRLLGNVTNKIVFMADDMIGTGGTLIQAMKYLKELGATKVICAVSLPLFSGNAIEDFEAAYQEGLFYRIIGTNAIYHNELLKKEWYIQSDVTGLFAQVISLLHHNRSVSSLLDNRNVVARLIKRKLDITTNPKPQANAPQYPQGEGSPSNDDDIVPYGAADKQ